jgi:hypothetical protein
MASTASLAQLQHGIDFELVNEKGTSLARAGERLEAALAALKRHEAAADGVANPAAPLRAFLVDEAAAALHALVVQRDAIGPTRHEQLYQIFGVPPEVIGRMGARRGPPAEPTG